MQKTIGGFFDEESGQTIEVNLKSPKQTTPKLKKTRSKKTKAKSNGSTKRKNQKKRVETKLKPLAKVTFSRSDATVRLAQIKKPLTDDEQINDYLDRNPQPDELGKFGKPQDPYRRSSYGRRSMEYDFTREHK